MSRAKESESKSAAIINQDLLISATQGSVAMAEFVLKNPLAKINYADKNGFTALIVAAINGHADMVRFLLASGASINQAGQNNNSALIYAAVNGKLEVIKILLSHSKCNLHHTNIYGYTASQVANLHDKHEAFELIDDEITRRKAKEWEVKEKPAASTPATDKTLESAELHKKEKVEAKETHIIPSQETDQELLLALKSGELSKIPSILQKGGIVEFEAEELSGDIETFLFIALMYAAIADNDELALALIDAGADKDSVDDNGNTALILSILNGASKTAMALIKIGANIDVVSVGSATAIRVAISKNLPEVIVALIEKGAKKNSIVNEEGDSLLMEAITSGSIEAAMALIECGADVNHANKYGCTALMEAANTDHPELVLALIKKGAKVGQTDISGNSALTYAVKSGKGKIIDILIKSGSELNPAKASHTTGLQAAFVNPDLDIIALLLKAGASEKNIVNLQALALIEQAKKQMVHRAKLPATEVRGRRLGTAAYRGDIVTVKSLLDYEIESRLISVAMLYAVKGDYAEIVQLLIRAGADVNFTTSDKSGDTALTEAAKEGFVKTAKILVECGATVDYINKDGYTALGIATEKQNKDLSDYLTSQGAKILAIGLDKMAGLSASTAKLKQASGDDRKKREVKDQEDRKRKEAARKDSVEPPASLKTKIQDATPTQIVNAEFFEKAVKGDLEGVKFLLETGKNGVKAQINSYAPGGITALMFAAIANHTQVMQYLLEMGAAIDQENDNGDTAFTLAATKNSREAMKVLILKGCNASHANKSGITASQIRVAMSKIEAEAAASELLSAALDGDSRKITDLIKNKKVNVNHVLADGATVLQRILIMDNLEAIQTLLEHGAVVDEATIIIAKQNSKSETVELLQKHYKPSASDQKKPLPQESQMTPAQSKELLSAAANGDLTTIKSLVSKGVKLNNQDGFIALKYAASFNLPEMAAFLLDNGVDIDHVDGVGNTALMTAAISGSTAVAKLLITKNANIDYINIKEGAHYKNCTALKIAVTARNFDLARALVKQGAKFHNLNEEELGSVGKIKAEIEKSSAPKSLISKEELQKEFLAQQEAEKKRKSEEAEKLRKEKEAQKLKGEAEKKARREKEEQLRKAKQERQERARLERERKEQEEQEKQEKQEKQKKIKEEAEITRLKAEEQKRERAEALQRKAAEEQARLEREKEAKDKEREEKKQERIARQKAAKRLKKEQKAEAAKLAEEEARDKAETRRQETLRQEEAARLAAEAKQEEEEEAKRKSEEVAEQKRQKTLRAEEEARDKAEEQRQETLRQEETAILPSGPAILQPAPQISKTKEEEKKSSPKLEAKERLPRYQTKRDRPHIWRNHFHKLDEFLWQSKMLQHKDVTVAILKGSSLYQFYIPQKITPKDVDMEIDIANFPQTRDEVMKKICELFNFGEEQAKLLTGLTIYPDPEKTGKPIQSAHISIPKTITGLSLPLEITFRDDNVRNPFIYDWVESFDGLRALYKSRKGIYDKPPLIMCQDLERMYRHIDNLLDDLEKPMYMFNTRHVNPFCPDPYIHKKRIERLEKYVEMGILQKPQPTTTPGPSPASAYLAGYSTEQEAVR